MGTILFYIFLVAYLFVCALIVFLVLAQEGKGGGLSGIAGSTALGDSFGFGGAATALRKLTRWSAVVFFVMTFVLTLWAEGLSGRSQREFLKESGAKQQAPSPNSAAPQNLPPGVPPAGNAPAVTNATPSPDAPPAAAIPAATATPAPATP